MSEAQRASIATILFTDLVDSTPLLQRIGDERAQTVIQAHHRMLRWVDGRRATGARRGTEPASIAAASRRFEGVKVLDLMWVMAGPAATRVLADYGATVVRVESSQRIETGRTIGPFKGAVPGPENSGLFQNMNAGKLGLALDLGVVTESFSPRAMKGWGLGYEELRRVKPDLVMLSSCLMGQTGPLAQFAGFGNLAAAWAGFFGLAGWPDRAPAGPFGAYTDYVSPRFAVAALLAALDHRRRTGEGQYVDLSQAEASLHFLAPALLDYAAHARVATRCGNEDPLLAPHGVYPAAGEDRWVAIAVTGEREWCELCAEIGRADLGDAPDLTTAAGRRTRRDELDRAIAAWTRAREAHESERRLQARGVAADAVQTSADCASDPQLRHRGHFVEPAHPLHGTFPVEGPRARLSRTPARVVRCGPTLGRDRDLVLREILGYDDARIRGLSEAGALR